MKNGITDQKKVSQNRLAKGHLTNDKNESAKEKRSSVHYVGSISYSNGKSFVLTPCSYERQNFIPDIL